MSVPIVSSRRPLAGRPIHSGPELRPRQRHGSATRSPSAITGSRIDHSISVNAAKKPST